jgi:5'-phosphate synthase pdxT subunit
LADGLQIGVLCLQGDYEAHGRMLERLGVAWRDVRRASQLDGLQGLIIPGGESTTMWHFLRQDGLEDALRAWGNSGGAVFGTCAGAIVLAREVRNPAGSGLGFLDITVERNSYGRQVRSDVRQAQLDDTSGLALATPRASTAVEAVLIRAPRILRTGPGVRVRARLDGDPVWVEQGAVMATTFHPELGTEDRPHRRFLDLARAVANRST